jgi:hypothetical protein
MRALRTIEPQNRFAVAIVLLIGFLLLRTRIVRSQGLNPNPGVGISGTRVQAWSPQLAIPRSQGKSSGEGTYQGSRRPCGESFAVRAFALIRARAAH